MVSRLKEKVKRLEAELESLALMITELREALKKSRCECTPIAKITKEDMCQRCTALNNTKFRAAESVELTEPTSRKI